MFEVTYQMFRRLTTYARNRVRSIARRAARSSWRSKSRAGGLTFAAYKAKNAMGRVKRKRYAPKKRKVYRGGNQPGSVSGSAAKIVLNNKFRKGVSKTNFYYTQSGVAVLENTAGYQKATTICGTNTKNQWLESTGSGYVNTFQNYTRLFDMNPYQFTTGSNYLTAQGATIANDRMYCKTVDLNVEFTNFSNIAGYVTLYYCTPKRLLDEYPETSWSSGLVVEGLGKSTHADVGAGTTVGTTGGATWQDVGQKPSQSDLFRNDWIVHQEKTFYMASGATINHSTHVVVNKLFKQEVLARDADTINCYIPKASVVVMAVLRGQVVNDTTVEESNITKYGSLNVDFNSTNKYKLGYVEGNAARLTGNIVATQVPINAAESNMELINAFLGAVEVTKDVVHNNP